MAIKKFNSDDYYDNIPNTIPLMENIQNEGKIKDSVADMLSNIIDQQSKAKRSQYMDMIGVMTPVTYYQTQVSSQNNYATDASSPSEIASSTKKFNKINNFMVKLDGRVNMSNEGEEGIKDYFYDGSLIILPRTIKPLEGDLFVMKYYDRYICYKIDQVELESFIEDSGFKCQYSIYRQDYEPDAKQIVKEYVYFHELVGTSYRPVLTLQEYQDIKDFEVLYTHLSTVFNTLFYDKIINGYVYRDYGSENLEKIIADNNNIKTLNDYKGIYRAQYGPDHHPTLEKVRGIRKEDYAYDNFLNNFIYRNRIFRKYEGIVLSVEPMLEIDRVAYRRSMYGALETRTNSNLKNIFIYTPHIEYLQPGVNSYLVGKKNVIYRHLNFDDDGRTDEFFPQVLTQQVLYTSEEDLSLSCNSKVYSSLDNMIIETVSRYIYKKTDDFADRFRYLFENIDNLYEDSISYKNIFYLFPMLGYVIEKSLQELYSDRVVKSSN